MSSRKGTWMDPARALYDLLPPDRLKTAIRSAFLTTERKAAACQRHAEESYGGGIPEQSDYPGRVGVRVGIVKDHMWYFVHNVKACRDLGIPYKLIDITGDDWCRRSLYEGYDAILVWPSVNHSSWKPLFDERLHILVAHYGVRLIPRIDELWLLDSKRRVAYWLESHNVPAPTSWVFYDRERALAFADATDYPVVCKTDTGAASAGVTIVRSRRMARRLIKTAFGRGLRARGTDSNDRQVGSVLFQEYIPHDYEWRVARIGPYYLCRRKTRVGDYASGSGAIGWATPPPGMLDFVREVTERGRFSSMVLDLFEAAVGDPRGRYLVNEMQCLVGAIKQESNMNEATGRWYRDEHGDWSFEQGFFYQNACANLRLGLFLSEQEAGRKAHQ